MRGRRLLSILMLVGGLALIVVVGLLFLRRSPAQATPPAATPAAEGQPTAGPDSPAAPTPQPTLDPNALLEVVVSVQTVPRGWKMTAAELRTEMRQAAQVGPNVITRIENAVGLYARSDIYQGETLTWDALVADPRLVGLETVGPSSLVPPGWLAMSIPTDRLASVAYGLSEGDTVDILLTFIFWEVDEQFQTLLRNSVTFYLESTTEGEGEEGETQTQRTVFVLDPYGRFTTLPTGDTAHIFPAEGQRPLPVSMILQNARVIQVGSWTPPTPVQLPTPTATLAPDAATPIPDIPTLTPTPATPDVILLALPPQQQLFLKYALESRADIDLALRGVQDNPLYPVENVDLAYLLREFNIEIPPNFNYVLDVQTAATATPAPPEMEATPSP
ncbi:MAG: SAF domain-containing protein [Chloroflexota bacterium]